MQILQWIYIAVGLLTLSAISIFTITQCFQWALDIYDKMRNPWHKLYYVKLFQDMSHAFYLDKKMQYVFEEIYKRGLSDRGFDVWAFRDLVEKEFGREQSNP